MAKIKIRYDLTENDFTRNFIHLANQDHIRKLAMKYNLASDYPQGRLNKMSIPYASKIVYINGVRVHLILNWSPENKCDKFGLSAFPDEDKYIEKYSHIFSVLYDIHMNRLLSKAS